MYALLLWNSRLLILLGFVIGSLTFYIEFDKRLNKTKKLGTTMSDDLLAYRLIKSANLSEQDEKVVKATCKLTYDDVKAKLKSIYGDASYIGSDVKSSNIKLEDAFEATCVYGDPTQENSTLFVG